MGLPPIVRFFDNLSVSHYSGLMAEETHYYPFGLQMSGLCDRALKDPYAINKYRFNGGKELQSQEFSDGSGLEWYDATHRMYDPQLGRFGQIDPLSFFVRNWSPYSFANDHPTVSNDPLGLLSTPDNPQELAPVTVVGHKKNVTINSFDDFLKYYQSKFKAVVERIPTLKSEIFPLATHIPVNPQFTKPSFDDLMKKESELEQQLMELEILGIPGLGEEAIVARAILTEEALEAGAETFLEAAQIAEEAETAMSGPQTTLNISKHAAERMAERGIARAMVKKALSNGTKYYDPKNKTINYVLEKAFASGKSLIFGRYPVSGVVSTVERVNKLNVLNRMIKLNP